MHSPKRYDKFETKKMIKRKQREQRLELHDLHYKTGVGSGASLEMTSNTEVYCIVTIRAKNGLQ